MLTMSNGGMADADSYSAIESGCAGSEGTGG